MVSESFKTPTKEDYNTHFKLVLELFIKRLKRITSEDWEKAIIKDYSIIKCTRTPSKGDKKTYEVNEFESLIFIKQKRLDFFAQSLQEAEVESLNHKINTSSFGEEDALDSKIEDYNKLKGEMIESGDLIIFSDISIGKKLKGIRLTDGRNVFEQIDPEGLSKDQDKDIQNVIDTMCQKYDMKDSLEYLVGTIAVETSEDLSKLLKKKT